MDCKTVINLNRFIVMSIRKLLFSLDKTYVHVLYNIKLNLFYYYIVKKNLTHVAQ